MKLKKNFLRKVTRLYVRDRGRRQFGVTFGFSIRF